MKKQQLKMIHASEIGVYAFCSRAWALEKRGFHSANRNGMDAGTEFHRAFGRREHLIRDLKILMLIVLFILVLLILRQRI